MYFVALICAAANLFAYTANTQEISNAICVPDFLEMASRGLTNVTTIYNITSSSSFYQYSRTISNIDAQIVAITAGPGLIADDAPDAAYVMYTLDGSDTLLFGTLYFVYNFTDESARIIVEPRGDLSSSLTPITGVTGMTIDTLGRIYIVDNNGVTYRVRLDSNGNVRRVVQRRTAEESCSATECIELIAYDYNEGEFLRLSSASDPTATSDALLCEGLNAEDCEEIEDPNGYCSTGTLSIGGIEYIGNDLAVITCAQLDGTTNFALLDTDEAEVIAFDSENNILSVNVDAPAGPLIVGTIPNGRVNVWLWCGSVSVEEEEEEEEEEEVSMASASGSSSAEAALAEETHQLNEPPVTPQQEEEPEIQQENQDLQIDVELTMSDSSLRVAWTILGIAIGITSIFMLCIYLRGKRNREVIV